MKSKYRKLEALYREIPDIDCKGLCHESCTIIPAAKIEIKRARERTGGNPFNPAAYLKEMQQSLIETPKIPKCKSLSDGKCTMYNIRPAICRLYGVAEGLECHYGCKPKTQISKKNAHDLIRKVEAL